MHHTNIRRARRLLSLAIASTLLAGASLAQAQSNITAPGLSAPGSITYDREGVPVIQAATENDAAFLTGYAHARDRFWQMDFNRRGASGQAAELVGPAALANDVQTRTLGLRRAAETTWSALSADSRGWLKAYASVPKLHRDAASKGERRARSRANPLVLRPSHTTTTPCRGGSTSGWCV
ncbi:MAG: penicillin acylase family protein, partial [Pseudomonadota bacterium]